jgi:hypothetical protein
MMNGRAGSTHPVDARSSSDLVFRDLSFNNCQGHCGSGILAASCNNVICDNIESSNITINEDTPVIVVSSSDNIWLNRISSHQNTVTDSEMEFLGLRIQESDIVRRIQITLSI